MSHFIDNLFSHKNAYIFQKPFPHDLKEYLWNELIHQLNDVESRWLVLCDENEPLSQEELTQYKIRVELLLFRLKEIERFLKNSAGPKIILFVCGELYDFIQERFRYDKLFTSDDSDRVAALLAIMISFFSADVMEISQLTFEEVTEQLQIATESLLLSLT